MPGFARRSHTQIPAPRAATRGEADTHPASSATASRVPTTRATRPLYSGAALDDSSDPPSPSSPAAVPPRPPPACPSIISYDCLVMVRLHCKEMPRFRMQERRGVGRASIPLTQSPLARRRERRGSTASRVFSLPLCVVRGNVRRSFGKGRWVTGNGQRAESRDSRFENWNQ